MISQSDSILGNGAENRRNPKGPEELADFSTTERSEYARKGFLTDVFYRLR